MGVVNSFKRRENVCDGGKVNLNIDDLVELSRWCDGDLFVQYQNGQPVGAEITIRRQELDSSGKPVGDEIKEVAVCGDYIIKYWGNANEGHNIFYVVRGDIFEAEYELR